MDSSAITKTGNFISENKKPLLYIGGALAIVIVGYAIVSKLKGGIGNFLKDTSKGQSTFIPIAIDPLKSTISDAIANTYANQLHNAMKDYGTDEETIYPILGKLENKEDFKKVYNAFGKRSYYLYGEPTISSYAFGYSDLDLVEWLKAELNISNPLTYLQAKKVVTNAGFAF